MCGIVSIISKRSAGFFGKEVSAFQDMLTVDQIRGEDSTGAFTVLMNRQIKSIKVGSHPADLYRTEGWKSFISAATMTGRVLVGHNRKATQGKVTSKNAHPFHEGHIHLVHNGMVFNHARLNLNVDEQDVDSHTVCKALSVHSAKEVISEIVGAFAFVWYDRKQEKLFAVRNEDRPLVLIETDDLFCLTSEMWIAMGSLTRNDLSTKDAKMRMLAPGELISIDLKGNLDFVERFNLSRGYYGNYSPSYTHRASTGARCANAMPWTDDGVDDTPVGALNNSNWPFPKTDEIVTVGTPPPVHFTKDDLVLIKIDRVEIQPGSNRPKLLGKIQMPNKPPTDVVGFLPLTTPNIPQLHGKLASAYIMSLVGSSCGLSIWINNIEIEDTLVPTQNGIYLTPTEWEMVVDECVCSKCGSKLDIDFNVVTSVNRKSNKYRCTCPDCIVKTLSGKLKDEFESRCDLALQNSVKLSQKPTIITDLEAMAPSATSLH